MSSNDSDNFQVNLGSPPAAAPTFVSREGTVSAMLIPARNYKFKSSGQLKRVVIPRTGKFSDNDPNWPYAGEEFDISPTRNEILFGELLKVLFATGSYPDLKDDQRFVIYSTEATADHVVVVGEVIQFEGE